MDTLRVLIAEDKKLVAAHLTAQLESLGHHVVGVAEDRVKAAAAVSELRPDLVIVDLRLPGVDGIEASRRILTGAAVPIILLTAYAGADLVRRAREAGVMAWLATRADTRELRATIHLALTRFRELEALCQETGDLQEALKLRVLVEQGKRIVMRRLALSEAEAFRYVRQQSTSAGLRLREIASRIVVTDEFLLGKLNIARCLRLILQAVREAEGVRPIRAA